MAPVDEAVLFSVNGRGVFALVPADVDTLAGETMETKSAAALAHMQQALDEVGELEAPGVLMRAVVNAAMAPAIFIPLLSCLARLERAAGRWLAIAARRRAATPEVSAEFLRQTRLVHYAKRAIDVTTLAIVLLFAYLWLLFVLRRFPYSRPWSDALRGFLLDR